MRATKKNPNRVQITYNLANTPLKAAQAPLAMARTIHWFLVVQETGADDATFSWSAALPKERRSSLLISSWRLLVEEAGSGRFRKDWAERGTPGEDVVVVVVVVAVAVGEDEMGVGSAAGEGWGTSSCFLRGIVGTRRQARGLCVSADDCQKVMLLVRYSNASIASIPFERSSYEDDGVGLGVHQRVLLRY